MKVPSWLPARRASSSERAVNERILQPDCRSQELLPGLVALENPAVRGARADHLPLLFSRRLKCYEFFCFFIGIVSKSLFHYLISSHLLYWTTLSNEAESKGLLDLSQTSKNLFRSEWGGIEPYSHRIIDGIGDGGKDARDIAFSHFLGAVGTTDFIAFSDDINVF